MCTQHFLNYYEEAIGADGRNLINKFFILFSGFECALKESSFLNIRGDRVYANWDQFASSIKDQFIKERTDELNDAVDYLVQNPPKVQSVQDGELVWIDRLFQENDHLVTKLNQSIRDVRNNLFHGGKYKGNFIPEVSRNAILLKSSIVILSEWLRLSETVRDYFCDHDFH